MEYTLLIVLFLLAGPCFSLPSQVSSHIGASYSDDIDDNQTAMDRIIDVNDYQGVVSVDGSNLREGDIAVSGRSQKNCFARSCLWTKSVDGNVYIAYSLSHAYDDADVKSIKKGMELIEQDSCVRFVPRTHQRDFLDIQPKTGCWSYLGARGGRQTISLQTPDCTGSGVTVHELMHALGFVHEQSRADRDKYVTIMWSNIWKGLVLESWSLPVQNSSLVHQTRLRSKREYSEQYVDPEEMNAMDRILRANQLSRGFPLREGDILSSGSRSAITCLGDSCRWPRSVDGFVYVPYIMSTLYDDMDRITIETGMLDISSATCVKFVPRTHQANFLNIQSRSGCWSYLGMTGGSQTVSLQSPGCMWSGVVSHELMHALGFVHEQSRSDRDHYVSILWENIMENQRHNFRKYETNNLNTAYDYSSVMHYGRYAFSEDGGPTIIPKPDPYIPIGQRDGPSILDIHKINILYNCGGLV